MTHQLKLFTLMSILVLFLQVACSKSSDGGSPQNSGTLNGKALIKLDGGTLSGNDQQLSGTGSIVFNDPIGEIGSNRSYDLAFTLEDGGTLQLISHGDNKLKGGVTVKLVRSGSELRASLLAEGKEAAAKVLDGVDATSSINLWVDVHNSESPTHILLFKANQENPSEDNCLYNSEGDDEGTPGKGAASFFGLVLSKAVVSKASVGEAKFSD